MNLSPSFLEKEVTRKEFLKLILLGMVSVMGFSTILQLLGSKGDKSLNQNRAHGYGGGYYGS